MSNLPRVLIHIGVGKTGTTSIQNNVFARYPAIYCAGRPNHKNKLYEDFYGSLTEEEEVDLAIDRITNFVNAMYDKSQERGCDLIVISDETICNAPMNCVVAERLSAVIPQAEILITIRNQLTAIPSFYRGGACQLKYVPRPYSGKPVTFADWFDYITKNERRTVLWRMHYGRLYAIYSRHFKSVRILPIESQTYHDRLSEILDVDASGLSSSLSSDRKNSGMTAGEISYDRMRRWLPSTVAVSRLIPFSKQLRSYVVRALDRTTSIELAEDQIDIVRAIYGAGNERLSRSACIDLASLGYPI